MKKFDILFTYHFDNAPDMLHTNTIELIGLNENDVQIRLCSMYPNVEIKSINTVADFSRDYWRNHFYSE